MTPSPPSHAPEPSERRRLAAQSSADGLLSVNDALPAAARLRQILAGDRVMRVLILSSDTGGGHRASAAALKAALLHMYPGRVRVHTADFWVDFARGTFRSFPEQYAFLAKHPFLWGASYHATRFPPLRGMTEIAFNVLAHNNVRRAFARFAPDLIVSVHPLVNTLSMRVLRGMRQDTQTPSPPYVTVVTDLGGAHPTWFNKGSDMTYVPTDAVAGIASACNLEDRRVRRFGLPVRKDFWGLKKQGDGAENRREMDGETGDADDNDDNAAAGVAVGAMGVGVGEAEGQSTPPEVMKEKLREKLGMEFGLPSFLLVGGGDGVGNLGPVAKSMAAKILRDHGEKGAQLVVICGKNKALKSSLEAHPWKIPVLVQGFVSNMYEWMTACDALCTKAGPGTIAEGLICGMPILISGFLPGQEEANVRYVVDKGCGEFASRPAKIAAIASRWIAEPETLSAMAARAQQEARPGASLDIVADIWEVATAKMADNAQWLEQCQRIRAAHAAIARSQLINAAARTTSGPNALVPGALVPGVAQSHLLARVRVLMQIIFGGVIAAEATNIQLPHMPLRLRQ